MTIFSMHISSELLKTKINFLTSSFLILSIKRNLSLENGKKTLQIMRLSWFCLNLFKCYTSLKVNLSKFLMNGNVLLHFKNKKAQNFPEVIR